MIINLTESQANEIAKIMQEYEERVQKGEKGGFRMLARVEAFGIILQLAGYEVTKGWRAIKK